MKDLFMCLLLNLQNHGNIVSAKLYKDSDFATIELEGKDCTYDISIRKEEKKGETENAE